MRHFSCFTISLFLLLGVLAHPGVSRAQVYDTSAKQAILLDYDTGMVLYEKDADARMTPSSMTKVMTMYLVFQALHDGRLTLDKPLPVSEKAWKMGGSKMFVEVGKTVKVEELIQGVAVQSGNDACIVLAESLSGTEEAFADAMNAKAREMGLSGTHFMDASGWPNPDHFSTARDLAILATRLIRDFPDEYRYFSEKEFTFNKIRQPNRNPLLFRNIGADGIKTGHTADGGYGLIGSGVQNGRRVVIVLNGLDSERSRAEESVRLLDWGLKGFTNVTLFKIGDTVEQANVVMGRQAIVPLTVERDTIITISPNLRNDLKAVVVYNSPLEAPIEKGRKLGVLKVDVPRVGKLEVPLVAGADVDRLGFFAGAFAKARLLFAPHNKTAAQ